MFDRPGPLTKYIQLIFCFHHRRTIYANDGDSWAKKYSKLRTLTGLEINKARILLYNNFLIEL